MPSNGHREEAAGRETRAASGWWFAALAVLWLPFLWRMTRVWSASVDQAHGWAVPLLAAYFAWERLRERPAAPARTAAALAWSAIAIGLAALPLALTVLEANASWPLAQWGTFGLVALVTLAFVARTMGNASARTLVFPLFFVTTALTWPAIVTAKVVGWLVALNVHLAATTVSLLGHPAIVSGNVIEVATGFVGINEACSGLRSLQAVWMAGWFFGELFRLSWGKRLGLVAGAVAIAVTCNWIRTTTLTWLAAAYSPALSEQWHDRAGGIELVGSLLLVGLWAWKWGRHAPARPQEDSDPFRPRAGVGMKFFTLTAVGAALVPVVWYRAHERQATAARVQWRLEPPAADWRPYDVPPAALDLLQATSARGYLRGGSVALLVRWDGRVESAMAGQLHDPSVCLPAAGLAVELDSRREEVRVDGVPIAFNVARFVAEGTVRHVFYCHWDAWLGRTRDAAEAVASVPAWRWERVRLGQRRADAAYLAFVVPLADREAAVAWLREHLASMLRRD